MDELCFLMISSLNSMGKEDLPSTNGFIAGYLLRIYDTSFKFYNPGMIDVISESSAWPVSVV